MRIVSDSETFLLTVLQIKVENFKTLDLEFETPECFTQNPSSRTDLSPLCLECIQCTSVQALVRGDKEDS